MMSSVSSTSINVETFSSGFTGNPSFQMQHEEDEALSMAINLGSLAIRADRDTNYKEAVFLYTRTVAYLQRVPTETRRCYEDLLSDRCQQYLRRVETLRYYLESNAQFYDMRNEECLNTFNTTVAKILLMERFCSNCLRCVPGDEMSNNCPSCNVAIEDNVSPNLAKITENSVEIPSAPLENQEFPLCELQQMPMADHFPNLVDMQCSVGVPQQKFYLLVVKLVSNLFD